MEIVDIYPNMRFNRVNNELSKNFTNDELFRNSFFGIHIKDADPVDILYRRMYEERYLNFKPFRMSSFKNCNGYLNITLSEAIYYVNQVTPPIIKAKYKDQITSSVETILDLLEHFLMEQTGQTLYHISEFKKTVGFNPFETTSSYNLNRNVLLRNNQTLNNGPVIDIMTCDNLLNELYNEDSSLETNKDIAIHCMFNCMNKAEINHYVLNMIDTFKDSGINKISVLNIFTKQNRGYFIELYIQNYDYKTMKEFHEIFKATYKNIIQ